MQKIIFLFVVGILSAFSSAKSYGQPCSLSEHKIESTGDFEGLVILVGFNDMPFNEDSKKFDDMLNLQKYAYQNAKGSVRDYFIANSDSLFKPSFKVVGPIVMDSTLGYYGENAPDGSDMRAAAMVELACMKASAMVNFADYDTNADGLIDMVYLFFAGYSENENLSHPEFLWAHAGFIGEGSPEIGGLKIGRYACSPEYIGAVPSAEDTSHERSIATIGTVCHEFGHILGLPDFYNTLSGAGLTLGEMSIMDHGNYISEGREPAGYSLFEREFVGWTEVPVLNNGSNTQKGITKIDENTFRVTLSPLSLVADTCDKLRGFKIMIPQTDEAFYFENRQPFGSDTSLPAHGLLIYYADKSNFRLWDLNMVNTSSSHMNYNIIRAGGKYSTDYRKIPFSGNSYSPEIFNRYTDRDQVFLLSDIRTDGYDIQLIITVK